MRNRFEDDHASPFDSDPFKDLKLPQPFQSKNGKSVDPEKAIPKAPARVNNKQLIDVMKESLAKSVAQGESLTYLRVVATDFCISLKTSKSEMLDLHRQLLAIINTSPSSIQSAGLKSTPTDPNVVVPAETKMPQPTRHAQESVPKSPVSATVPTSTRVGTVPIPTAKAVANTASRETVPWATFWEGIGNSINGIGSFIASALPGKAPSASQQKRESSWLGVAVLLGIGALGTAIVKSTGSKEHQRDDSFFSRADAIPELSPKVVAKTGSAAQFGAIAGRASDKSTTLRPEYIKLCNQEFPLSEWSAEERSYNDGTKEIWFNRKHPIVELSNGAYKTSHNGTIITEKARHGVEIKRHVNGIEYDFTEVGAQALSTIESMTPPSFSHGFAGKLWLEGPYLYLSYKGGISVYPAEPNVVLSVDKDGTSTSVSRVSEDTSAIYPDGSEYSNGVMRVATLNPPAYANFPKR